MTQHCSICGKRPSPYPNWVLSQGHAYHLGCLVDEFNKLRRRYAEIVDHWGASGERGPWCDDWEGSFDAERWGHELYEKGNQ